MPIVRHKQTKNLMRIPFVTFFLLVLLPPMIILKPHINYPFLNHILNLCFANILSL